MKALLPYSLLLTLLLFTSCTTKPSVPLDAPNSDTQITIPDTPPPDFFEAGHSYTEIYPNVFKFETFDDQGKQNAEGYQVWGYDARQWYSQNIVKPHLESIELKGLNTDQLKQDYDLLKLEQDLLTNWNPADLKPQTKLGCTYADAYARATATIPHTPAGTYGTSRGSANAKSCLYTATAIADASGGGRSTNDFDNTKTSGQRAGASASQSGYCCFDAKALADGPPAYKRVYAIK